MATSTFTVSRDQIITSALRKLGVMELGDTLDPVTTANASLVLNLLIKQMSTQGIKLWTVDEAVLPLVNNQTTYVLGGTGTDYFYLASDPLKTQVTDKPLKLIQSWLRNIQVTPPVDIPMQVISKQEYNVLGSKFSTGTANSVFYDPRRVDGKLSVFLTPNTSTVSNYELHFVYQRPIYDITTAQAIIDFPNEWMNVLVWNLADQLAIEYGVPANSRQEIAQRASAYKEQLMDWDVEEASVFFRPNAQMTYHGGGNVT
jgi:hypothetical protein